MEDNGRLSSTAIDVTEDDCRNDGYHRRIMREENRSSRAERKEGLVHQLKGEEMRTESRIGRRT
jgi:hypothetical protein